MSAEQKSKRQKQMELQREVFSDSCCCFSSLFYSEPFFSSFIIRQMLW